MKYESTAVLSNASDLPLTIWIEPWCDELELPAGSTLSLAVDALESVLADVPIIEVEDDRVINWASCAGTLRVAIDDQVQDTGSRSISLPAAMFEIPVRSFVETVFGDQPAARSGGRPPAGKPQNLLSRIYLRLKGR